MTIPPEHQAEWDYRYAERIAILCGQDRPTREQREIAIREADEWVSNRLL